MSASTSARARGPARYQLLALAALLFLCICVYLIGTQVGGQPTSTSPEPRQVVSGLSVTASSLNFGEVAEEEKPITHQLKIRNDADRRLTIDDFILSCNCLAINPRVADLEPGEELTLSLDLDTTHRGVRDLHLSQHELRLDVQPSIKHTPTNGARWEISGIVKRRVTLDTLRVNFGEWTNEEKTPRKVVAKVHIPAQTIRAKVSPSVCDIRIERATGSAEAPEFTISLLPLPTLPRGPFVATLNVIVVDPLGHEQHGAKIPIEGDFQSSLRLLPARIVLPETPVNQDVVTDITLQGPHGQAVVAERWETDSVNTRVTRLLPNGLEGLQVFRVTYRITKAGDQRTVLYCTARAGSGPTERLMAVLAVRRAAEILLPAV